MAIALQLTAPSRTAAGFSRWSTRWVATCLPPAGQQRRPKGERVRRHRVRAHNTASPGSSVLQARRPASPRGARSRLECGCPRSTSTASGSPTPSTAAGLQPSTRGGTRGGTAKSAPAAGRPLILVHGLLLSQEMHRPLAEDARRARQPRDHGRSARPRRIRSPARHVALLDGHLRRADGRADGPPRARAGGRDGHLARRQHGAGDRLARARASAGDGDRDAGARQRAAVERADVHAAARRAHVRRAADEAARARGTRAVPRRLLPHYGNVMLDLVRQEPGPGGAVLQGLFFGRIAPHRSERRTFRRRRSCSATIATRCTPSPTRACSPRSCRTRGCWRPTRWWSCACSPERLTEEIAAFLDEVWTKPRAVAKRPAAKHPAAKGPARNEQRRNVPRQTRARQTLRQARGLSSYFAGNSSSSFTLTWPGGLSGASRPRRPARR